MIRFLLRLLPIALLLAPLTSLAETKADEARKHFNRSKELFDDGDFAASLNELERAYAAVPNVKLLYNIGHVQGLLQNYAEALKTFRRFLVEGGAEITEARRGEVLREIDKFRVRVAELTISAPDGAEIAIDDVVIGKAPLAEPVTVNIGRRKVSAALANHFPVSRVVAVAGLESVNVKLTMQSMLADATTRTAVNSVERVATTAPATPKGSAPLPVWVPWAGAVLLGGGSAVVGALAGGASKTQTTLIDTFGTTRPQLDAALSKTRTLALTTDILLGCTAAAVVGSIIYTIIRLTDQQVVALGFGGSSLVLSGTF